MLDTACDFVVDHEPEYEPKCCSCWYFVRGEPASRMYPEEPDDCNHPVAFRSSYLPNFPFQNGCKYYESRRKRW